MSEFQTRKTVEIGPAETLTNMMKRTRDLVYRPFDTANDISREFLSIKKNKDDIYFVGQEKEVKAAVAPKKEAAAPAPAKAPEAQQPTPTSSPAPIIAGPVDDAPVIAADLIRTIVSIALKKPAKDVAFDQSVKGLSGGEFAARQSPPCVTMLTSRQDGLHCRMRSRVTWMLNSGRPRTALRSCR